MNILVTGANGQLGLAVRKVSEGFEHECIFTSLHEGEGVLSLDVTDSSAVLEIMEKYAVDVIINCAGYTDVNKAEEDVEAARRLNALAPAILAEASRKAGAVLVHVSTDYVFDGKSNIPYLETDEARPLGKYAESKLEGDRAVMESGCRYLIFRTSWLYSCYGRNFFRTIEKRASCLPYLNVVDDQVGTPTYAPDLAQAIFWIIEDGKLDRTGLYNYSNEGVCSWYDFAVAINRGLGYTCDVRPCRSEDYPSPVQRPAYSVLDKNLFRMTFGYDVPHWEDSLAVCIAEYQR